MKTQIKLNPDYQGCWDLFVDDKLELSCESFTVCSNVELALQGFMTDDIVTEADEVAKSILASLKKEN